MPEFNYDNSQIERLIARAENIFRQRFQEAIRDIRDTTTLQQLETLLAVGQFEQALTQAELVATNLSNAYITAYLLAADDVMDFVSNAIGVTVRFDQVNFRAVEEMQRASLRLITEFTSGQRAATRAALVEGIRAGLNPRDQARAFRQSIGLTANQARAVVNFRRSLEAGSARALNYQLRDRRFDTSIQRAISGEPLSSNQIDRMVQRYYDRFVAHRATTIARTEALAAVHQGSDAGFRQASFAGVADELSQTWHTSEDGRVRHPSHTFMNGQVRPLGEPFLSGTGNLLRYPGDGPAHDAVNCRCAKSTQFTADALQDAAL